MSTIKKYSDLALTAWQRWLAPRPDDLRGLDASTLADIGVHPSEFGSIEAESRGTSALSRRRIVECATAH